MALSHEPLDDMPGVAIGHWTDHDARTGCTVISFEPHALTAAEVRGAAPGTRELDALAPGRLEQHADAIVLTGGSAFGLRAADGVAAELAARGRGYVTSVGPVPIVPAAVIFDLMAGRPVAPTVEHGRFALAAAKPLSRVQQGAVGAGAGATWDKLGGAARPGGIGIAQITLGEGQVLAVVVLNAMGVVLGEALDPRTAVLSGPELELGTGEATTLISVVTSAACDHAALTRMCIAAHDALARSVIPAHTVYDGDVAFASTLTEGTLVPGVNLRLSLATELAVEAAVRRAAHPGPESGATLQASPFLRPGPDATR